MDVLVTVYKAGGIEEAEIIKGLLGSNGIHAYIERTAAPDELLVGPAIMYDIPVKVAAADAPMARKLILQKTPDGFGDNTDEE